MSRCAIISGSICFAIVFITGVILFACSFSVLEVEYYGLVYNNNNKQIENEIKDSGRYFLGLGKKFIKYPRSIQKITFSDDFDWAQAGSLNVWNKVGVNIWLDMSIYLQLNKDYLRDFYFEFGDSWYAILVRIITVAVKDVTPDFDTIDYFQSRGTISTTISTNIQTRLDLYTQNAVTLVDLQIQQIYFEDNFEDAVIQKLIAQQEIKTAQYLIQIDQINKEIDQIISQADNEILIINAKANAVGNQYIQLNQTIAFTEIMTQMAVDYTALFTALSITTDDQKLDFIYANEIVNLKNTSVLVRYDSDFFSS